MDDENEQSPLTSDLISPLLAQDQHPSSSSQSSESRQRHQSMGNGQEESHENSGLSNNDTNVTTRSTSSAVAASYHQRILSLLLSPLIDEQGNPVSIVMGLISIFVCGSLLGLVLPKDSKFHSQSYATLSSCLGYTYFFAWSISFYPQVVTNFRRRTTAGLSVEFCSLNVLGFTCYSIFNVALYSSVTVQDLYRQRNGPDASIPVQSNDVAFAIHALALSSITLLQILHYDGIRAREISPFILTLIATILVVGIGGAIAATFDNKFLNWLDYVYVLSFCKIAVTLVKYIPQVVLNWKRRSTTGWSIWQILLDLTGGLLSNLQLVLDCVALNEFSGLTGNIPKLLLGQVSIVFDVIFCLQHYVLYPSRSDPGRILVPSSEEDPENDNFVDGGEDAPTNQRC
ncbi:hypothetical protein ACA910_005886 [Epithemia clementina (nom. ined.)]